jgi:hypothetical protein
MTLTHMSDQDKFDYFYRKIVRKEKVWRKAIPLTGNFAVHNRLWEIYYLAKDSECSHYITELFADLASDFHLNTNVFHDADKNYLHL